MGNSKEVKKSMVRINNIQYFRARVRDRDNRRISVYGQSEDELNRKVLKLKRELDEADFRKDNPTVAEYCGKWLAMQAPNIRATTLQSYKYGINKYVIAPLGSKYMSEVTADDIKLALLPAAKQSASTYAKVNMLFKCLFYSAEESGLLGYNPVTKIPGRGGIQKKKRRALTNEQVDILLETIRGLPPYLFVMIGLYSGLRKEEILALQWDCVFLDKKTPYISVRRAWHREHNRPVISSRLKTESARRDVPIPESLCKALREAKENSISEYVIADREGKPLSDSQFTRVWAYIRKRSTKERTLYKYVNGQSIKKKFKPVAGGRSRSNKNLYYCLDFEVTPHQLRHTYITNLINAGVDPKTVQYLAGHKSSKITMDVYAETKYNKPEELYKVVDGALSDNIE